MRGHFRYYCLRTVVLREQGIIIYNKPAVYWEQGKNVIRQRKDKEKKQEKKRKEKKLTHINGKTVAKINHAQKNQAKNCGSGKK